MFKYIRNYRNKKNLNKFLKEILEKIINYYITNKYDKNLLLDMIKNKKLFLEFPDNFDDRVNKLSNSTDYKSERKEGTTCAKVLLNNDISYIIINKTEYNNLLYHQEFERILLHELTHVINYTNMKRYPITIQNQHKDCLHNQIFTIFDEFLANIYSIKYFKKSNNYHNIINEEIQGLKKTLNNNFKNLITPINSFDIEPYFGDINKSILCYYSYILPYYFIEKYKLNNIDFYNNEFDDFNNQMYDMYKNENYNIENLYLSFFKMMLTFNLKINLNEMNYLYYNSYGNYNN